MTSPARSLVLFRRGEFGVGLEATFPDVHALVLFFLGYADADRLLQDEPDDEAGREHPGKDREDAVELPQERCFLVREANGVVGIWGLIAVCFTNEEASFLWQLYGILAIFSWVFVTSLIVWFVLKKTIGIRVSEEEEYEGVDIGECGLEAYPEFTTAE